jgi:hypothetical protein
MKRLVPIIALALLAALPCAAQEPFVVVDQERDVPLDIEDGDGLNLATITFSRKGSSKIEIDIRMNGTVPKSMAGDYAIMVYLDIDDNPATGISRGNIATEVNVCAYKSAGRGNWECKLDKTSSLLAKESFQITKFNQYKDGFTINVSSPFFKKTVRIRGYAETISDGKALDRAPAEDFFTWRESGAPTSAAPAQE